MIGATIAAVLALAAIGVGIFLAVSGGSSSGHVSQVAAVRTQTVVTVTQPATTSTSQQSPEQTTPGTQATTGQAPSQTSTPGGGTTTPAKPATPAAQAATPQNSQREQVADTVEKHFHLIGEHKFSAAYALLAPSLKTGEESWVQSHRENGIYKVDVSVSATVNSPESATASIVNMKTFDTEGCKNWSGSWGLTKIDGQWRISEANISAARC